MKHIIKFKAKCLGNGKWIEGDLLDETGTDGEPLINNVKIIKKL